MFLKQTTTQRALAVIGFAILFAILTPTSASLSKEMALESGNKWLLQHMQSEDVDGSDSSLWSLPNLEFKEVSYKKRKTHRQSYGKGNNRTKKTVWRRYR
jgi:hypothetical protein